MKGWCSKKYVGVYAGKGGGKFTIKLKDDVLYSQLNDFEVYPMFYKGNDKFLIEDNGAEFIFNLETGQLSLIQIGVGEAYTYTKE